MSDHEVSPEVAADLIRTSLKTAEFAATAYAKGRQDALREVRDILLPMFKIYNGWDDSWLFGPGGQFEIEEPGE